MSMSMSTDISTCLLRTALYELGHEYKYECEYEYECAHEYGHGCEY